MMRVDLHLHSNCSDGTLSPGDLVRLAKGRGVLVISLTDHDTTEGLDEFMKSCERDSVHGIAGVELSADAPYTIHILGYRFRRDDVFLEKYLSSLREYRDKRNAAICKKLNQLGVEISLEEVEAEAGGEVVARPHFARVLVRKGYALDLHVAFRRFLAKGGLAYVPRVRLSPLECIDLISKSGGVSVLAHPGEIGAEDEELLRILSELKAAGLWGLECYSAHHKGEDVFRFLRLANGLGLRPTAGSDFHGENRPGVDIGITVPNDAIPWDELGIRL
jgi:predicted metal-dependent phosphoesterase TrpH